MGRKLVKLCDIPKLLNTHESYDFIFLFCTFLDDFKRSGNSIEMIADEPVKGNLEDKELCILACAAHKLANDNGLKVPEWVHNKKYIMTKPAYAFDTKNTEYQKYLKETSPQEYSQRNIFYGDNVHARV